MENLDRRDFIKKATVAATTLSAAELFANSAYNGDIQKRIDMEDLSKYDFIMPRVKFACDSRVPDHWNASPRGDRNLLMEFQRHVRCKVKDIHFQGNGKHKASESEFNAVVQLEDLIRICRFPFLFMTGEGGFKLSQQQKMNVKHYLEQGGFILMDDCVFNNVGDYFYKSSFSLLTELFGTEAIRKIPHDHEVFHNVFNFETGMPFLQGQNYGARGVFLEDRLAVFLSSVDLHCGWTDDNHIWFGKNGERFGPGHAGYQKAIEMGINILMYSITH